MEDIGVALRSLSVWEMGYVCREENMVAHVLASLATHDDMNIVWLYDSGIVYVRLCIEFFVFLYVRI